ncbi:MAG: hypothetical protein ABFS30_17605 [Pseudomonadota bacterium]
MSQDLNDGSKTDLRRREALTKLGLAVTVAYSAPVILHLDRSANAQATPSPACPPPSQGKPCRP